MTADIQILIATAAAIAFFHTLMGPDHYLPFVALAKARNWTIRKVVSVTLICGFGHIVGSIVLGAVGVFLGMAVGTLEWLEALRGDIAAWALIAFGLIYLAWGLRQAYRRKPHCHMHRHGDLIHSHSHNHNSGHVHLHEPEKTQHSLTPWFIFIIFVLGPCEPLIPLLMYPAAQESMLGVLWVTATFGLVTMVTMLAAVIIAVWGLQALRFPRVERYGHVFAGITVLMCGLSIQVLGL